MSNRTTLKSYFVTNAQPTAANFADLIDSGLNPLEDSIKKLPAGPVAVEAQPDKGGTQEVLQFFKNFKDTNPAWKLNLNTARTPGLSLLDINNQSRLFIKDGDGNVGIGNTNPVAKLHIGGGNLVVEGNVGIGNTAPNFPLSFPNTLGQKIALWGQGGNVFGLGISNSALQIHTDGPGSDVLFGQGSSTSFTETMRVKGNGNVGIGTNNPRGKLEVAGGAIMPAMGNTNSSGILFGNDPAGGGGDFAWIRYAALNYDATGNAIRDDKSVLEIGVGNDLDDNIALMPSGNVGVGIRNPLAKLHLGIGNLVVEKGRIGIGTTSPFCQLANTDKNTIGSDAQGGNPGSFAWAANQNGYVGQFFNEGSNSNSNGVVIKVGSATAIALDVSQGIQDKGTTSIFCVRGNGNVGIGTNNPQAKLEVIGSQSTTFANYGYLANAIIPTGRSSGPASVSIKASDRVIASEFDAISDVRTKKSFSKNDPQHSLSILNHIQIKDYLYKDEVGQGTGTQKGVIAQELETILPEAVSRHTDFVPDIYAVPQSVVVHNTVLTITMKEAHQLQTGDTVRLITTTGSKDLAITALNQTTFSVEDWREATTDIFVYGKQVADFRTVNYNSIFCLGISAIQALHRQMQQLKEEVTMLKEKLSTAFAPAF